MDDMRGFAKDLQNLANAVAAMQKRIDTLSEGEESAGILSKSNSFLLPRKDVLSAIGIRQNVSRASWSHDRGDAIIFDAWDHQWERNQSGHLSRYPMRTNKHYNLMDAQREKNRGHTRWQHHVDMVLAGKRSAIAIMPVSSGVDDSNRRTKGWLPQYVTGEVKSDGEGQYWFYVDKVSPI